MRKLLTYTLLLAFLLPLVNKGMQLHFCGKSLTGFTLLNGIIQSENCDCDDDEGQDCCADIVIKAPATHDQWVQKVSQKLQVRFLSVELFPLVQTQTSISINSATCFTHKSAKAPPPAVKPDLAFMCVFRI